MSDSLNELWRDTNMKKIKHLIFKKIRDIKGIFHSKMGTIKDRNGMDLTEAEELYKKRSSRPR